MLTAGKLLASRIRVNNNTNLAVVAFPPPVRLPGRRSAGTD
jgi:hypothetical protein